MEKLNAIISNVLELDESKLTDELTINDVDSWDSLRQMELIANIEDEFGIELTFDEISDMNSIKSIREIVASKVA